ncbi:hypothetical protein CC1G_13634 [Coprinopsis cinerea okayama7|uniref:Exonuclease domain-containing protein n=1 Tax=Coprinopsis cinerea (strain Okayama-7 / 130 / ATCC MYA-4618 / FGSC 9003) TaxID=240176 RepID=D6RK36_COPC7|nr:hypothetical protein CC1G_13634 [Coprinopsis cinerea okayama7\|eukprot:XP_002912102.1 hypothetical protein CC1G_13634 [Coprinopsis cinerea okayama7\
MPNDRQRYPDLLISVRLSLALAKDLKDEEKRVSIVDYRGAVVYDHYVVPTLPVTDYRTGATGITESLLQPPQARSFQIVQQQVANLIKGKILVGHSLWNDLSVLGIPHPAVATRDVALYQECPEIASSSGRPSNFGVATYVSALPRRATESHRERQSCP